MVHGFCSETTLYSYFSPQIFPPVKSTINLRLILIGENLQDPLYPEKIGYFNFLSKIDAPYTAECHYFVVFFFSDFAKNYELVALSKKNENFQGFLLFFADFRRINVLDILIRVHFCLLMSWFENGEEKISSKKETR